jgi:hypothetical protein
MASLKALGQIGFPVGFFQNHWGTIGTEIVQVVLEVLNSGAMPSSLTLTYIALIPKVKNLSSVTEFRLISLCNVLYKLIFKVLANRLKILHDIISPTQSTFILGRLITNNILATYETLHTMHSRMKEIKGFMAVKLDMSKAYDGVEWVILEETMRRLGFAPRWVQLIMMCVTTVQYSILVNGEPCGKFSHPKDFGKGIPSLLTCFSFV